MEQLETGEEKVQKICDALKRETLEPAQREAARIVEEANALAKKLVDQARREIEEMKRAAHHKIEEERNVFDASLTLAAKQAKEALKQDIEKKLFNEQLLELVKKETSKEEVITSMVSALVKGIEKEGLEGDITAIVAKSVDPEKVSKTLAMDVKPGKMDGGAEVKIEQNNLTLSLSDEVLTALFASFLRDDFRKILFRA